VNVLFILADQFRADCLAHLGNEVIQTPNLDRLASEGVSFTHCFNQTAPCGPSRMSIYTSRYLCSTRAVNNMTPLLDAEDNYGFALRQAGYDPGLIGYNDYAVDPDLLSEGDERLTSLRYDNVLPGFERVYYHEYDSREYFDWLADLGYPEELRCHAGIHQPDVPAEGPGEHLPQHFPAKYRKEHSECRYVTDRAIEYVRERSAQRESGEAKGWVLSLNYIKPHPPNICCEPYCDMYDPADMSAAARNHKELVPSHPYLRNLGARQLEDDLHLREYRACYYGMITEVDDNLGLLFKALEETGEWEDTLIIFSADHAEHLGDHYLTGKGQFYDGGMRIPYIIRDPSPAADGTRGQVLDHFVEAIDSAPTLIEALGEGVPDRFQGRSLLPLLRGEGAEGYEPKTEIHYEFDYRGAGMAAQEKEEEGGDPDKHLLWVVRDREFKYIHFADEKMPPILFDLRTDPDELDNVAGEAEYASVELNCCQRLLRWRMYCEDQRGEHWAQQYR
jgi:arylsulfatase A-like enzyme